MEGGNRCHCRRRRPGRNEVSRRTTGRYNSLGPHRTKYIFQETAEEIRERRNTREEKRKLTTSEFEHPIRWPRINPPLVVHPWCPSSWSLFFSLPFSSPSSRAVQGYNPRVRLRRIIDYRGSPDIFRQRLFRSNFNASFFLSFSLLLHIFPSRVERDHTVSRFKILTEQH